jgi:hypothetical protein
MLETRHNLTKTKRAAGAKSPTGILTGRLTSDEPEIENAFCFISWQRQRLLNAEVWLAAYRRRNAVRGSLVYPLGNSFSRFVDAWRPSNMYHFLPIGLEAVAECGRIITLDIILCPQSGNVQSP